MPKLIIANRQPLGEQNFEFMDARDGSQVFRSKSPQAIVWGAITEPLKNEKAFRKFAQNSGVVPIPFLIDSGCTEAVVCHEWHFRKWLYKTVKPSGLPQQKTIGYKPMNGIPCQIIRANFWVFPSKQQGEHHSQPNVFEDEVVRLDLHGCVVSRIDSNRDYLISSMKTSRFAGILNFLKGGNTKLNEEVDSYLTTLRNPKGPPANIFPRVPIIGMKLLQMNRMNFTIENKKTESVFSLSKN